MPLFYGPCRKFSAFPILLFAAGWGLTVVSFVKRMLKPALLLPRWDNYPAIIAVGVGPIFVLAALLQACLPGTAGAAMGSLTAVSAVVFMVSLGNSSITAANNLYQYNDSLLLYNTTSEGLAQFYLSSTLAGSILCGLAITMLLSLWSFYQSQPVRNRRRPVVLHPEPEGFKLSSLFPGYARKLAVPCILLASIGWGLLVGGHHHRINTVPQEGRFADNVLVFDFGQWGACILTPLLLLFGLLHAGFSGSASMVMGVVNAALNGLVLTSIGYYMIHDVGLWLKNECQTKCDYTLPQNWAALCEIVGSFALCFFWSAVLGLWPFYKQENNTLFMSKGNVQSHRTAAVEYQELDDGDTEAIKL